MKDAEKAMEGVRIKVPDEVSEEVCPVCGRNLVIKSGRFGRFLACPGYPECSFTMPIVVEMPGKCPKCGSRILKRTSKRGYTYYACERGAECGFMTWDVPTKEVCPECGKTMFKPSGRGRLKAFCINENCPNFTPEDKRCYRRKSSSSGEKAAEGEGNAAEEAAETPATAKKGAAKKTASKKSASGGAAKKTSASGRYKKSAATEEST